MNGVENKYNNLSSLIARNAESIGYWSDFPDYTGKQSVLNTDRASRNAALRYYAGKHDENG